MGTYDTRGGAPISPNIPEPHIFDEEDSALILFARGDHDEVIELIHKICGQREVFRDALEQIAKAAADYPMRGFAVEHAKRVLSEG